MSFKFLQISDMHFDAPILMGDSALFQYQEEQKKAFSAAIDIAVDKKVQAFIICGDLYYEDNLSYDTVNLLNKSFMTLYRKGIKVIYAHGSIDPSPLPEQIKVPGIIEFTDKQIRQRELGSAVGMDGVAILGIGYCDDLLRVSETIPAKVTDQPVVGMVYLNPSEYHNETLEGVYQNLKRTGFSYWALGGRHGFGAARGYQNMTYSGSPTGTSYFDSASGAALVELDDQDQVHVERIPLSNATWHNIKIKDISRAENMEKLQELLVHTVVSSVRDVHSAFVCLCLSGPTNLYDQIDAPALSNLSEALTAQTGAAVTVTIGHLYPSIDINAYRKENTPLAETLHLISKLEMDETIMKKAVDYALSTEGFYAMEESQSPYGEDTSVLINGLDKYVGAAILKENE